MTEKQGKERITSQTCDTKEAKPFFAGNQGTN
jgi:hypothetical protein